MKIKPMLFNTDMVLALLREGNPKTVTRRTVKGSVPDDAVWGYTEFTPKGCISCRGTFGDGYGEKFFRLPCQPGDVLYVHETWKIHAINPGFCMMIRYKADNFCNLQVKFSPSRFDKFRKFHEKNGWQSPYFMPKEAARIWIKVTDVRVERLQEVTKEDIKSEGIYDDGTYPTDRKIKIRPEIAHLCGEWTDEAYKERFAMIWDSTIRKPDLARYGWKANPWVWVIEFEQCSKPEVDDGKQ